MNQHHVVVEKVMGYIVAAVFGKKARLCMHIQKHKGKVVVQTQQQTITGMSEHHSGT